MQTTPFHIGIIARPDYNPPELESLLVPRLKTLILQKSLTHHLGFFVTFAQPVAKIVGELATVKKWGVSGYVAERSLGVRGWLRCWLQIAASSDALIVVGPATREMEFVVEVCQKIGCDVRYMSM